jgi:hypothetical protein
MAGQKQQPQPEPADSSESEDWDEPADPEDPNAYW